MSNADILASLGPVEKDETPYCLECGSERLVYVEQYANGEEWRCKDCGTLSMWDAREREP